MITVRTGKIDEVRVLEEPGLRSPDPVLSISSCSGVEKYSNKFRHTELLEPAAIAQVLYSLLSRQ
jgi:hypothetical protein